MKKPKEKSALPAQKPTAADPIVAAIESDDAIIDRIKSALANTRLQLIPIRSLKFDDRTQLRADTKGIAIESYADEIARGQTLPPPLVCRIGDRNIVVDGEQRVGAHRKARKSTHIECSVFDGDMDLAMAVALSVNATHGVQRSKGDKRNAVQQALRRYPGRSSRFYAEICKVSHEFVNNVRKAEPGVLSAADKTPKTILTRNGRRYPVSKTKPAAKPASKSNRKTDAMATPLAVGKIPKITSAEGFSTIPEPLQQRWEKFNPSIVAEAEAWPKDKRPMLLALVGETLSNLQKT